jgi:hypothetical protein
VFFSEVKQNLDFIISFVDSHPKNDKYYPVLREIRQEAVKEQHKRGTQNRIS